MELAQRRELTEDDGIVQVDIVRGDLKTAVLIDSEVAKEARHRVRTDTERRECKQSDQPPMSGESKRVLQSAAHKQPLL